MKQWFHPISLYCCLMIALWQSAPVVDSFAFSRSITNSSPRRRSNTIRAPATHDSSRVFVLLHLTPTSKEEDAEKQRLMLEKARTLREEAQQLETKLRETKPAFSTDSIEGTIPQLPLKITSLLDSVWTFTYRFSSQPKDDDDNDNTMLPNYSGKITIRLKGDGYSKMIALADDRLQVPKVWGWDEEYSSDDQNEYLLFSMDVRLPKSDPKLSEQTVRYYFQARVERDERGAIFLRDGTVTVKKDIAERTNGVWGLFQVGGILTEFRYVGDFAAKPSSE